MKILIDEQLPTKLKYRFIEAGFDVHTVRDMNWLGKKNGDLLETMALNNFSVLLTNDKNLYYQQKTDTLKVCIVNINSKTNRYDDVLELINPIKNKLKEVETWLIDSAGGYFMV
jgi:predicted nuclease of predicted toxin-antitoxin system